MLTQVVPYQGRGKSEIPAGTYLVAIFYTILFLLSIQPENVKPCIFNTTLVVFSFTRVLFEATLPIDRY